MGFGINKWLKFLSLRMLVLEAKRLKTKNKFRNNKLQLSIGCDIINTQFGKNNYLGENVCIVNSTIGDYSYINRNTSIRNTEIGKFCSIGPNVQIILGKHPFDFVSSHPVFYAKNKPFKTFANKNYIEEYGHVTIGNDVWIGEGALIPSGVSIGNGAVITARAVVTRDVEPYSVVGGVPAKHIKYRFGQETIKKINEAKWWNWDDDKLEKLHKVFHNPNIFIQKITRDTISNR